MELDSVTWCCCLISLRWAWLFYFYYSKMCYLNIYYLSAPHSTFPCCDSKLKAEEQKDPSRSVSSSDWKPGQKEMKGTAELLNENRLISGPEHPGKRLTRHHFSDFPSSHCPGVRKWKAFLDFFFLPSQVFYRTAEYFFVTCYSFIIWGEYTCYKCEQYTVWAKIHTGKLLTAPQQQSQEPDSHRCTDSKRPRPRLQFAGVLLADVTSRLHLLWIRFSLWFNGGLSHPTEAKKHWTSFTSSNTNKTNSFSRPHVMVELCQQFTKHANTWAEMCVQHIFIN